MYVNVIVWIMASLVIYLCVPLEVTTVIPCTERYILPTQILQIICVIRLNWVFLWEKSPHNYHQLVVGFLIMSKCFKMSLTPSWRSPYHTETSPLIWSADQWTDFYMIGTSLMKELNRFQLGVLEQTFFCNRDVWVLLGITF